MLRTDNGGETTFREAVHGRINNDVAVVRRQLKRNLRRPLPQVDFFPANDYKVALFCGGPSLNDAKNKRSLRNHKIATVNGTYKWALDNGFTPSVFAMLDTREFNARFVDPPVAGCKYLIASHCHPSVFDALKGHETYMWHTVSEEDRGIVDRHYMKRWRVVPGGSTIGSRMLFLLYMIGVRSIRVYGMDCCYALGAHHAYEQKENDGEVVVTAKVGKRRFRAAIWMLAQLDEFFQLAPSFPPDLNLSFEGDGLLQYMVQETAKRGKVPRIHVET